MILDLAWTQDRKAKCQPGDKNAEIGQCEAVKMEGGSCGELETQPPFKLSAVCYYSPPAESYQVRSQAQSCEMFLQEKPEVRIFVQNSLSFNHHILIY